ncbi:MAG: hypothetical protein ACOC0J_02480, partial [Myxococcota bacterium]
PARRQDHAQGAVVVALLMVTLAYPAPLDRRPRKAAMKQTRPVSAPVALLLLLLLAGSACFGPSSRRADEFDKRLEQALADEELSDDYDDESWQPAPTPAVEETLVEHRPQPVVDPGARSSSADTGPLMYLNRLNAEAGGKELSGYALIWEDARVFSSSTLDEDSSLGRLGYRPDHWRASGGQVIPVRVVADHGAAVEVETMSSEEARDHCAGSVRGTMKGYRLRMFVARNELVPVLSKEFSREFEDGSVAHAPPGVAVRATREEILVRLARGAIEVPGPEDLEEIALSYSQPGFPEERLTPEPMPGVLSPSSPLRLGGRAIQLGMLPGNAARPRWVRQDGPDGASRIFMANRCMGMVLVTDDPDPVSAEEMSGLGLSGIGSGGGGDYGHQVRAGAPAYWQNGPSAGVSRERVSHSSPPEEEGGRLCFPLMGVVKICHDHDDVTISQQGDVEEDAGVVEETDGDWGEELDEQGEPEVIQDRGQRMLIFDDEEQQEE